MDVSRRSFLGGVLALTAVAVAPKVLAAPVPRIMGDGVHDDAPGLQAMLDGRPFWVADGVDARWIGAEDRAGLVIRNGSFALGRGLHFRGINNAIVQGCDFFGTPDFRLDDGPMINIVDSNGFLLADCTLTMQQRMQLTAGTYDADRVRQLVIDTEVISISGVSGERSEIKGIMSFGQAG